MGHNRSQFLADASSMTRWLFVVCMLVLAVSTAYQLFSGRAKDGPTVVGIIITVVCALGAAILLAVRHR